jgi:hypothetical protein
MTRTRLIPIHKRHLIVIPRQFSGHSLHVRVVSVPIFRRLAWHGQTISRTVGKGCCCIMGSSSSKATRKLPTKARRPTPSWAGARTPHPDPLYPAGTEPARSVPPPNQTSQRSTADPRGLGYATGSMRPNMGVSESKTDGKRPRSPG